MRVDSFTQNFERAALAGERIEHLAPFLKRDCNALARDGLVLTRKQCKVILVDFAKFSKSLPALLNLAKQCCPSRKYELLREEIDLNLAEELGEAEGPSEFFGLSHYMILREEIIAHLEVDSEVEPVSDYTSLFISRISAAIALGGVATYAALFALEATAVPEILIFKTILERAIASEGGKLSDRLALFFDAHVSEIEVAHAARLAALYPVIIETQNDLRDAAQGFNRIISAMEDWWGSLASALSCPPLD